MQDAKNGRPHGAAPTNLIHRFCTECDRILQSGSKNKTDFNPRLLCRMRKTGGHTGPPLRIQSTGSAKNATGYYKVAAKTKYISIRASCAGYGKRAATRGRPYEFNPRVLQRMRLNDLVVLHFKRISIHAFYAECGKRAATRGRPYEFNSRILHRTQEQTDKNRQPPGCGCL